MVRNKKRSADYAASPLARSLSMPGVFLIRMLLFLALVGFIAAILFPQFEDAFQANPGLNGLIIAVLGIGIIFAFWQVFRLYPEIRWVNAFRIADPGLAISHKPRLLLPMATMLRDRTGSISLSTASMTSIMESLGSRLDEARDTGRYLVALLVFLGLLGTFWGLLDTIQSVGKAIGTIDTRGADTVTVFDDLKSGLAAPLRGMGTAFSSSLLGLAGSLILGFLELQASHAQNRFYNELEEWLSGITELTPGTSTGSSDVVMRQLSATLYDMQRVLEELNIRLGESASAPEADERQSKELRELAQGVGQLITQMRSEQQIVREWVDEQASQQAEVANVLKDLANNLERQGS